MRRFGCIVLTLALVPPALTEAEPSPADAGFRRLDKAPTYGTFKQLVGESAGIASKAARGGPGQGGGGAATSNPFTQRDTNNDGTLGRDELPAVLFDRLDADKDGFVTPAKLKALRKPK